MKIRILALLVALGVGAVALAQGAPGAFEQLTVAGTAGGFSATTITPSGKPVSQYCVGYVETADIRYRTDGTAPTASVGMLVPYGSKIEIAGQDAIRLFSAIRTGSTSAVIAFSCYPVKP